MTATQKPEPKLDYFMRPKDVWPVVGVGRTAFRKMISRGEFPKPVKLNDSGRAVGWLKSEVTAWQEERKLKRAEEQRSANAA